MKKEYESLAKKLFADEYEEYVNSLNKEPIRGFVVNTSRVKMEQFDKMCTFNVTKLPFDDACYTLNDNVSLIGTPIYDMGLIYPKEPSSMIAPLCLDLKDDDIVLDMCASPGGKTCQIASAIPNGLVYANEYVSSRLKPLYDNVRRMAYDNVVIVSNDSADFSKLNNVFDKILVDAPCSGEGMFRKDKNAMNEWTEKGVRYNHVRSVEILNNLANALKPNGMLVYSTCTFNTIENEEVVDEFLSTHLEYEIVRPKECIYNLATKGICVSNKDYSFCMRFYPHKFVGEGQFVAVLHKKADIDIVEYGYGGMNYTKKDRENCGLVDKILDKILNKKLNTYVRDNKVYSINENYLSLGLNVINPGVYIGEFDKNVFKPDHNIFVTYGQYFVNKYILDDKNYSLYVRGHEIDVDDNMSGLFASQYNNIFVGGGKAVNGKLKNYYPKHLRIKG